jgi:FMN phosphatase YigB (HAD superfamily)
MLAGIRAAIVDLDGTSLDTMGDFDFVLTEVWRDRGMPAMMYTPFLC